MALLFGSPNSSDQIPFCNLITQLSRKHKMRLIILSFLLVFQTASDVLDEVFAQETMREVSIPQTEIHEFKAENGTLLDLYVGLPSNYVSDGSVEYPVIYSTDASSGFAGIVQTYRLLAIDDGEEEPPLPPVILVGIDRAPASGVNSTVARFFDLTPTSDSAFEAGASAAFGATLTSGGADTLLTILKDEIIPWVEARYPTAPERGISGYSLGGLFATHALLESPETFTYYLIGSPSFWWDNGVMFEREEALSTEVDNLRARVFMSVGSLERMMVPDMLRMAEMLISRNYENLEVEAQILHGETHLSGVFQSMSRGFRYLLGPR